MFLTSVIQKLTDAEHSLDTKTTVNAMRGVEGTAAAAYFSGIGEVSGWVEDPAYSADGVHIDNYPSKSAAHYVSKINNALSTYYELYESSSG